MLVIPWITVLLMFGLWVVPCLLFLYGVSPMECEFCTTTTTTTTTTTQAGTNGNYHYHYYYGRVIKFVECTSLRILNDRLPTPPLESPVSSWYSNELTNQISIPFAFATTKKQQQV